MRKNYYKTVHKTYINTLGISHCDIAMGIFVHSLLNWTPWHLVPWPLEQNCPYQSDSQIVNHYQHRQGLQEKFCKAEQDCFGARDRLRLPSKLRIWGSIKPLVNFHKCLISCATECPDNIYLKQSSDKHNQLMQQGVTCWSYFIVTKMWSTAIKIIYKKNYNPNRDHEKTLWNLRLWGPSEIHRPLHASPYPRPMYRLTPHPLIGLEHRHYLHVVGCYLKLC